MAPKAWCGLSRPRLASRSPPASGTTTPPGSTVHCETLRLSSGGLRYRQQALQAASPRIRPVRGRSQVVVTGNCQFLSAGQDAQLVIFTGVASVARSGMPAGRAAERARGACGALGLGASPSPGGLRQLRGPALPTAVPASSSHSPPTGPPWRSCRSMSPRAVTSLGDQLTAQTARLFGVTFRGNHGSPCKTQR